MDKAEEKIKFICENLIKSKGLEIEGNIFNDYQKQAKHHYQLICKANLDKAEESLKQVIKSLMKSVNQWRESESNFQASLTDIANSISESLKISLKMHLSDELKNPKADIICETWNDLAGKDDVEGLYIKLLSGGQQHFHKEIEIKSHRLADHYLDQLDTEVALKEVSQEFYRKTYSQDYLSDINPIEMIEEYQNSLRAEYRSICRWAIMAELVKMPILLPTEKTISKKSDAINSMFESAAEALSGSASSLVVREKISDIVNRMVPSPLNVFVDAIGAVALDTLIATATSSDSKEDKPNQLMSRDQLIEIVKTHIDNKMIDECIDIIQQQFSLRYSLALGIALTSLETLFFYELGKFRIKLQNLSETLITKHRIHVEVGNSEIQAALIAEDPKAGKEISQALELLAILSDSKKSDIEENEPRSIID
jgi:hypothetical protein